jgi:hypothetical protein
VEESVMFGFSAIGVDVAVGVDSVFFNWAFFWHNFFSDYLK